MSEDAIEKTVTLRAKRSRVWRAISTAKEFGAWFGIDFGDASFAPGAALRGQLTNPAYAHISLTLHIEQMDAETLFSYRWHPHAIDPKADYSAEPLTRVEFRLRDADGGKATELTVIESGFLQVPETRRAEAFRANSSGWTLQAERIATYLADTP